LALRGVGQEAEAESVRFHVRRVTKVNPESQTRAFSGCGARPQPEKAAAGELGAAPTRATSWGSLHIPAERFNSDHTAGSDPDFSQFPKDFVHNDGPLAVYGTRSVRLECLYLATFKDDETLTWMLHVTAMTASVLGPSI